MHADECVKSLQMDENPCIIKLSLQHFFSFEEDEEDGKICVHDWKHFPISCLEEEEEEEEIQIWFKKTNLGIVVGKITLACNC
jgi:hypothetical protein